MGIRIQVKGESLTFSQLPHLGLTVPMAQKGETMAIVSATNHMNHRGELVEFLAEDYFRDILNNLRESFSMLSGNDVRDERRDYFVMGAQSVQNIDDATVVKYSGSNGVGFVAKRLPVTGWFVKRWEN
jgi:hypothetical protein